MKRFLPKDLAGEIKRQEKVTRRIEAAYFGSVEKNMDLLIMKSPIMNSGPTASLNLDLVQMEQHNHILLASPFLATNDNIKFINISACCKIESSLLQN